MSTKQQATEDDGYDGVQYDTFYAPDPQQLEAEAIRRECAQEAAADRRHPDHVLITRPY
jgi:hypothetical protein